VSRALAAHLAELLVFELTLDLFRVLGGEVVGALAHAALHAEIKVLGHRNRLAGSSYHEFSTCAIAHKKHPEMQGAQT
jgi:hypothetical protein